MSQSFVSDFFQLLRQSEVSFVVLRGYEGLPHLVSNDIDLFVLDKSIKDFHFCLSNLIYQYNGSVSFSLVRQGVFKMLVYVSGIQIKIDVWSRITFMGLEYVNNQSIINRAKCHTSNAFLIPCSFDEFHISFYKEILHNKWVRADKRDHLCHLLTLIPKDTPLLFFLRKDVSKVLEKPVQKQTLFFLRTFINCFFYNVSRFGLLVTISSIHDFFSVKYSFTRKQNIKNMFRQFYVR